MTPGSICRIRIGRISGTALLTFAIASAFTGCLSRPPLNTQTFAFGAPVLNPTNVVTGDRALRIRSLHIAPPFDARLLVYRTGEFSYQRDPYAGFAASPSDELVGPICGLLRGGGCFQSVVEPGSAVKPDTLAEIGITQLYGDIRKPESPLAVLALDVRFFDITNGLPGRILLQRSYSRSLPVNSTSPAALMAGWTQALAGIFAEVNSDFRRCEGENPAR
ncbi:MAG: hypothetical protein ABSH48_02010 [Verrucomicrobiota bacterium]